MDRRGYLASIGMVGSVVVAGCMGGGSNNSGDDSDDNVVTVGESDEETERPDSDNDGVPDIEDDYPDDPSRSQQVFVESDTRNIEEDSWYYYELEFTQSGILEYQFTVREGPAIDVIVMDESEYQYFEEDERGRYYPDLSVLDSVGDSIQEGISSGNYRLVFDNSERAEAAPPTDFENNVVEVEFTFEGSV